MKDKVIHWVKKVARAVVTTLVGSLMTLLFAGQVLPLVGAALMANIGATGEMSMFTVIMMAFAPMLFVIAVCTAFVLWAVRGMWRFLAPKDKE